MQAVVLVSDPNRWALDPFVYLSRKYWRRQTFIVAGFAEPLRPLPPGWDFLSLGDFADYPAHRWSDALLKLLLEVSAPRLLLMLEDYWLTRQVDAEAIGLLDEWLEDQPDVLRVDLTTDRLYSTPGPSDLGPLDRLDLIEGHPQAAYHMSLQAGLWRRELLASVIVPGETPWEVELIGTARASRLRVVGTRQAPMQYLIGIRKGKASLDGSWQYPPRQLLRDDAMALRRMLPV